MKKEIVDKILKDDSSRSLTVLELLKKLIEASETDEEREELKKIIYLEKFLGNLKKAAELLKQNFEDDKKINDILDEIINSINNGNINEIKAFHDLLIDNYVKFYKVNEIKT
jgi:predicted patatin/cPLA2 family phospholipase